MWTGGAAGITTSTMAHCSTSSPLNPSNLFSHPTFRTKTLPILRLRPLSSIRIPQSHCATYQSSLHRFPVVAKAVAVDSPTSYTKEKDGKKLLLEVKDLTAVITESQQKILNGVNLTVYEGEVHAIMGKNGSGKSTFSKVLVGHPDYEVTGGTAIFKGQDLLEMDPEERSLSGIFMSFQSPVAIPGVSNADFLNMAYNARQRKLGLPELGPIEVLGADLAILDEIDSGLDVDALQDVARAVNDLLTPNNAVLMITHYQRLLDFIKPAYIHIMENGRIVKTGDISLASVLEKEGYKGITDA
ncbi:ABC transporter I family member 6, chloroplastic-like isoform X2 [Chenopodium quinoa]|uniref:ABC transporter I family member 6, chloroplastic-like isoform X2 n=1 Tax=Chenopodium quinoa TaxID=63459 RepID=UPI000B76C437|nr:ABC transporter I family member 6, chloroplastic-like isoform X2 [Chenopodium quinoa]